VGKLRQVITEEERIGFLEKNDAFRRETLYSAGQNPKSIIYWKINCGK
jgi:hypothetical protein